MNLLVTGCAGFIGSHLCETLLRAGHTVVGIDSFVPYYPETYKRANLRGLLEHPQFRFVQADLRTDPLEPLVRDIEGIYHLAAMPGLVKSWTDFDGYWTCNVLATQRLLEAVRTSKTLKRFLYGSTSSVYGKYASGDETLPTRPVSPYGVTKLAGEHLCRAHAENFGLPLIVVRFFSVYGPRQRPDMAYHKFIRALLRDEPITLCGDGHQMRGNTYIDDCVEATLQAMEAPIGETFNIGGADPVSVWDVLHKLEAIAGRKFRILREPERPGDQRQTFADTGKLTRHRGWKPKVGIDEGLARQWEWQKTLPL